MPNQSIPASPDVLRWARERSGYSITAAAGELRLKRSQLSAIESGDPLTNAVFREMQRIYGVSEAVLLFPFPPPDEPLPRDFRSKGSAKALSPPTLRAIREAQQVQHFLTNLRDEEPALIPAGGDRGPVSKDAETTARRERLRIGISVDEQSTWPRSQAFRRWANVLQNHGVFVMLKKMDWADCRGVCLGGDGEVPIIVVNSEDNEGARCFTLFHEYAHYFRGQTATCLEESRSSESGRVETWCNRFAAAFLMPSTDVQRKAIQVFPHVGPSTYQLYHVQRLASAFRVSVHAMARRLDEIGLAAFYKANSGQLAAFDRRKRQKSSKRTGGGPTAAQSRLVEVGARTSMLLLRAIREGVADPYEIAAILQLRPQNLAELDMRSRAAPA